MSHEKVVLFNDTFINTEEKEIAISMEDRGLQFGDGIYEVVRIYDGEYHLLEPHLTRFWRSMHEISIIPRFTKKELGKQLQQLIKENGFENKTGIVYFQLSRGVQERNHVFELSLTPTFYAYLVEKPRPVESMKYGITASIEEDIRWNRCDIKSLNLLPNLLAKTNSTKKGFGEGLFVRKDTKVVTEGSASNFFMIKDGILYTHPSDNWVLNGIVRQEVIRLAQTLNIPVVEKTFGIADVLQAEECFFTSTSIEVMPVTQLETNKIGNGEVGEITKQLQEAFQQTFTNSKIQL